MAKEKMFSTDVFTRKRGVDTLSANMYYGLIGLFTTIGLGFTAMMIYMFPEFSATFSWITLIGMFLVAVLGIFISCSENPILSFIGLLMISGSLGLISSSAISAYSTTVILKAFLLTGLISSIMTLSGFLFPDFYKSIGGALFVALCSLLLLTILNAFIPLFGGFKVLEFVGAGIFSLYIGYDMYRASVITKTVDNAIDTAIALYLDIMNLFVNILSIIGDD